MTRPTASIWGTIASCSLCAGMTTVMAGPSGNCDLGQPIMAAAALSGGLLLVREALDLQPQGRSSAEPPRKAAAAMIGCPTSQLPETDKHPDLRPLWLLMVMMVKSTT